MSATYRPRFFVDFNDPTPFTALDVGDEVLLEDGEGNSVEAIVREIRPPKVGPKGPLRIISFTPNMDTWQHGDERGGAGSQKEDA